MDTEHTELLLDEDVQNELADHLLENGIVRGGEPDLTVPPWTPSEDDEATVERYKRAMRHFRQEQARIEATAQAELDRIAAWKDKRARHNQRAIDYLFSRLEQFSELTGKEKHDSPNGVLKWRKGSKRVTIEDEDAWCNRFALTDFVRAKLSPDKTLIAKHIKDTGEIPEGVEYDRGPDKFIVEVPTT